MRVVKMAFGITLGICNVGIGILTALRIITPDVFAIAITYCIAGIFFFNMAVDDYKCE